MFAVGKIWIIFYAQIFQLLQNIASRNGDIYVSNSKDDETIGMSGLVVGASLGFIAGHNIMGPVGSVFGALLWGWVGAKVAFAYGKSVAIVLSMMDEREKQHVARIAIQVAHERHLDFLEEIIVKAILDNPDEARFFLITVLKRLNFEVEFKNYP